MDEQLRQLAGEDFDPMAIGFPIGITVRREVHHQERARINDVVVSHGEDIESLKKQIDEKNKEIDELRKDMENLEEQNQELTVALKS